MSNSKFLELIGFGCIVGTIYAFLGLIVVDRNPDVGWPVFWAFALGALGVILFRKWMRKRSENANS